MIRQEKSGFLKKLKQYRVTIIIVIVLVVALFLLFGSNARKIKHLEEQKVTLTEQIEDANEYSAELDEDIGQLGTKAYIESIARKYLNLYYPDEQIVLPSDEEPK